MLIFWGKRGGFESLIAHFPVWSDFAEKRIAEKLGFFVRSQDGLQGSTIPNTRPLRRFLRRLVSVLACRDDSVLSIGLGGPGPRGLLVVIEQQVVDRTHIDQ